MIDTRIHPGSPTGYTLHRVRPDGTTELVSGTETTDRIEAIDTGRSLMREHPDAAFTLFEGSIPRDKFGHKALVLLLRPGSVEMLVR